MSSSRVEVSFSAASMPSLECCSAVTLMSKHHFFSRGRRQASKLCSRLMMSTPRLDLLADAIAIARANVENGVALPGIDAGDDYNDFAFALPANASYLARKRPFADQKWAMPPRFGRQNNEQRKTP